MGVGLGMDVMVQVLHLTAHAEETDRTAFAKLLMTALQQLHEGGIARYRLRRSEYSAWQQMQPDVALTETATPLALPAVGSG